jgi:hypothetical protein
MAKAHCNGFAQLEGVWDHGETRGLRYWNASECASAQS